MKTKIISIILVGLILLTLCSCRKFIFSDYKSGDVIESIVDGNIYKLNSKFVMFDDAGALNDSIVRVDGIKYENAGDFDEGTEYYNAVMDKVYCNEDFIIVTLKNDNEVVVIDCNEKAKKNAIHKYNSLDEVKLDLNKFTLIECSYY